MAIALAALLQSCNSNNLNKSNKKQYFDFSAFFTKEIADLAKLKAGIFKTIQKGDDIKSAEADTVNWNKELEFFFDLDINLTSLENKYETTVDSGGRLMIISYFTRDTTLKIQRISITKKDDKIQLIEADLIQRSSIVDRDTKLSYQPRKGYGIVVKENYVWSKPSGYEIFAEIRDPAQAYY